MNEEKKYLDEISAKQLIDSTKEYVQNEIDGIETLGIQYNEEESALEFVGGSVITGSDSGSGGASSKEYSLIENKLYINPTGNSIGMNTITCSTGTLGSVFDKTSVEIMTNFVVKESTEDAVVYNIDKVEIGTRTGTALGAFDGRFVKIFVGAYLLDILEKIKSDGTISYITTYEPRKDIISPVEKTDEMTQEVGLDSNTGKLYTAPGGGGGASSWNDLTGVPTIEVKTVDMVEVFPETTLTFSEDCYSFTDVLTFDDVFKEGNTIVLTIDGTSYTDIIKTYVDPEIPCPLYYIGDVNLMLGKESTGEPYLLYGMYFEGQQDIMLGIKADTGTESSTHTVKIEAVTISYSQESLPSNYPVKDLPVSWNSLKDRPFYIDRSGVNENYVLFEEQTIDGFAKYTDGFMTDYNQVQDILLMEDSELTDGAKFTVTLDGEAYDSTAVVVKEGSITLQILGNLSMINTDLYDNGLPFAYLVSETLGEHILAINSEETSHTVKITCVKGEEKVVKIPKMYLPDNLSVRWNNVAGKPFGITSIAKGTSICEEYELSMTAFSSTIKDGIMCSYITNIQDLGGYDGIANGDFICVTFDGVDYFSELIFKDSYNETYHRIELGNRSLADKTKANTGEPFYIDGDQMDGYAFYANSEAETHTIGFSKSIETIRTLPPKYYANDSMILKSTDSNKLFKITVNDSGTITATEM